MKIILYQPQIPQNTGNIVRTCSAANADLVLVRPLGFSTNSRHLKRAGLDYWEGVNVEEIDDLPSFLENKTFYFFSSKGSKLYTEIEYEPDAHLIFGSETAGLPQIFWDKWPNLFFKIPISEKARCLNLACSVSIVLFEGLRYLRNKETTKDNSALATSDVEMGK